MIISKQPSKDIPVLDLEPVIHDRVREMEETSQDYEQEEEEESKGLSTDKTQKNYNAEDDSDWIPESTERDE